MAKKAAPMLERSAAVKEKVFAMRKRSTNAAPNSSYRLSFQPVMCRASRRFVTAQGCSLSSSQS
ncbi:hypothetical protein KMT30_49890, partial [Streptomyces sp. IBSBF 2953]|nr:hypothetical protein [Streptomyces hayashii]